MLSITRKQRFMGYGYVSDTYLPYDFYVRLGNDERERKETTRLLRPHTYPRYGKERKERRKKRKRNPGSASCQRSSSVGQVAHTFHARRPSVDAVYRKLRPLLMKQTETNMAGTVAQGG